MRFGLLGPLSVDDDGPVEIRGGQRRTLLAALLLEPNTAVSADRLVDLLWGTHAAAPAGNPLYNQITRLRKALGDTDRIRAVAPGYLIHVEPGELDTLVFAEHASAARRALAEQNWPQAEEQFAAALALWRGSPLEDIPALSGDIRPRELEETRDQVLHGRIEADLHLGRHEALTEELPGLVEAHPRHAAFRGQLMLALYRSGQRTEALAVYDAFSVALAEEFGLEPPAELRDLYSAIEREDHALALDLVPEPTAARDQGTADAPRQLPADVRTFTGRNGDFEDLLDAAEKAAAGGGTGTLVISALDGMGGIGKTALAVRVAHRVAGLFPDGQLFIDLRGHASAEAVQPGAALAYLLRSLGVPPQAVPDDVAERAALYRSKLVDRRTLILLDNAADAEQVRPLLPDTPSALLLITSRSRLAGLDGARSLTLDTLSVPESVALLRALAGPERDLTESAAVLELAELCGHLPLALRIVAARLRHHRDLTVEDLAAGLRDEGARLDRLTDGERDLTSVFDSSFANLPEPEQNLLRLLGHVPGPDVDVYAAANLLGTGLGTAERLLESLLESNLLIQPRAGRYGTHDLIRAYLRTQTVHQDEGARADLDRLLAYYQCVAWTAARHHTTSIRWRTASEDGLGPLCEIVDAAQALSWLRTEKANLLAAARSETTPPERRIDLTAAIGPLLLVDTPWSEAAELHLAAERDARSIGDRQGLADSLRNFGQIVMISAKDGYDRPKAAFEQALALYRDTGCRAGEADVLFRLGLAANFRGEFLQALEPSRESLRIFRDIGDLHGQAHALQTLTDTERLLGRTKDALRSAGDAVDIHRRLGNRLAEASALQKLGYIQSSIGELDAGSETLGRALEINREFKQRHAEAAVLNVLGYLHTMQGAYEQAETELRQALAVYEDLGDSLGVGVLHAQLGRNCSFAADADAAIDHLEQAKAIFEAMDNSFSLVEVDRDLGWARHLAGDAGGRALLERALTGYSGPGANIPGKAETLIRLGHAVVDGGDPQEALNHFEQALPLTRQTSRPVFEAYALDGLARCRELLGDREQALDHLREAVAMYRRIGLAELPAAEARLAALEGGHGGVSERPGTEVS